MVFGARPLSLFWRPSHKDCEVPYSFASCFAPEGDEIGGESRIRTDDGLHAKQVLYHLSYIPMVLVQKEGIEPSTPGSSNLRSTV
jgi:hypothetical protein